MRLLVVLLLVAPFLVVGCVGINAGNAPAAIVPAPRANLSATDLLATLNITDKPNAKRAVDDLEAFATRIAPQRYGNILQHDASRDWLESEYKKAGLNVTRFKFDGKSVSGFGPGSPGQDIVATLPGADPKRLIVFGGHYDGAEYATEAAYDDGSGTLITLELARAAAKYNWTHTLVFAGWDQEEQGLVGSAAFAKHLKDEGYEVDLYMNFDMVGLNWPAKQFGAKDAPISAGFGGPHDKEMAALWTATTEHLKYPKALMPVATGVKGGGSDHTPFIQAQYTAVAFDGLPPIQYPMYHNIDTFQSMIAAVGGNREDVVKGFDTILQGAFVLTFLVDAQNAR